ncbi:MAG: cytochrome c-550 PedF [Mangrovicoccus sp.]|nr:cytochrome c-550 PedF [Mangrovicoccus sp.]
MTDILTRLGAAAAVTLLAANAAFAHGDVAPQPMNTDTLPDLEDPEEWLTENPYREMDPAVMTEAIRIGASGYNQNCARCHGLEAISGGLAPDLRFLEAEEYGDEWFVERFQYGYTQNGITKMPAFGELLGQKAAWAIRSYIETRPDDEQITEFSPALKEIRDQLADWASAGAGDAGSAQAQLEEIGGQIETLSGAPVADSIALRAAAILQADPNAFADAQEVLTVGLSAAQ